MQWAVTEKDDYTRNERVTDDSFRISYSLIEYVSVTIRTMILWLSVSVYSLM
jgi:hypothetical protein